MRKILCTLAFGSGILLVSGQTVTPTVLASDGGYSSSAQGSIAWTIGEPVVDTYVNGGNVTTMGFHQPEMELVTMIDDEQNTPGLLVYPNPVKEVLTINFAGMPMGNYSLQLNDALGKLIYQNAATITSETVRYSIKLNEIAEGVYFLNISAGDFVKTVKINKVN